MSIAAAQAKGWRENVRKDGGKICEWMEGRYVEWWIEKKIAEGSI
jgi:hypothetical protein